ncbi:MAG: glycosyltransferase, partial [Odoribacter sp.]|nr:glycosyltransferase [Odoribacter sp.]
ELAGLYAQSLCFVNPTYEDTFPTTNMEALACGTPVITYRTGGSPEMVDEETGFVVEQGDTTAVRKCIDKLKELQLSEKCRKRAVRLFSKEEQFKEYVKLYEEVLNNKIIQRTWGGV